MHEDGEGVGGLGARVRRHESAAHGLEVLVEGQQGLLAQGQSLDLPLLHIVSFRWDARIDVHHIAFFVSNPLSGETNFNLLEVPYQLCDVLFLPPLRRELASTTAWTRSEGQGIPLHELMKRHSLFLVAQRESLMPQHLRGIPQVDLSTGRGKEVASGRRR